MIESKTLDSTTASFFYEIGFAFNIADSLGFAALVDQCQFDRMHTCIHTHKHNFIHDPAARCGVPVMPTNCSATLCQEGLVDSTGYYPGLLCIESAAIFLLLHECTRASHKLAQNALCGQDVRQCTG